MNENEIEVTATPAAAQAEQVQQVEQHADTGSTEATAEQTQEQTNESAEDKAKREPWFQKRIGELTREKYEARNKAEQAAQEAQLLRDRLAQLQQGDPDTQQPANTQEAIRKEAAKLVAEQSFNDSCNRVYSEGVKEFKDFPQAVQNLQMIGVSREFLELATTSDASAKLLHHLGSTENMDEAARIAALPPVQMARELTRLEFKLAQTPAPPPVSKAPAPVKPISASGNADTGLRDDLPADEWLRRRNAKRFK